MLFDGNTALGWRVTRPISFTQGESMVATGHARHVNDTNGQHIGYQMRQPEPAKNGEVSVTPTPVVITVREMDLLAGRGFKFGKSRTASMSEVQRLTRVHSFTRKLLPPEDEIERAAAKLKAFTPLHLQAAD